MRLTQQDQLTRGRVEDWMEGNDRLISRIAQNHAPLVAAMINQQGARGTAPRPNGQVAALPAPAVLKAGAPPAAPSAQAQPAAARPARAQVQILVPRVSGAPGDGPDSLTAGMKRALGRRNFAIVTKLGADSLTVRGKVSLKPFNNNRELITITWEVLDPQNKPVGEIEQSNVIPAGSLNGEWGPIAREITVAAAEGLLDLLDKAIKAARE
jgi:hypothetical protein